MHGSMSKAQVISSNLFKQIIRDQDVTGEEDISILQTIYNFENHEASATAISKILGFRNKGVVGKIVGFGMRLHKKYDVDRRRRLNGDYVYWDLFFDGHTDIMKERISFGG